MAAPAQMGCCHALVACGGEDTATLRPLPRRVRALIVLKFRRGMAEGWGMKSAAHWCALAVLSTVAASMLPTGAGAQSCGNRGQLDTIYCDDNDDLVADAPADPRAWKDPATLY